MGTSVDAEAVWSAGFVLLGQGCRFIYLTLAALWWGSMSYSLVAVQPKIARYFRDKARREELLTMLADGNRWKVVTLIAGLVVTAGGVIAVSSGTVAIGFTVALTLDIAAGVIFVNVSWRHWPARVFALPDELPGFHRRLRHQAWAMSFLVGGGYLVTLAVILL